jgi:hypothetical protein
MHLLFLFGLLGEMHGVSISNYGIGLLLIVAVLI